MNFTVDSITVVGGGRKGIVHDLVSDLNGEVTLQEFFDTLKATLIIGADEFLSQEQANGFDKEPIMLVDGRKNRDIRSVYPLGQIEFIARQQFSEVLIDAYNGLLSRSKVLYGVYIKSHYVFHNGKQVATDMKSLKSWLASGVEFKDSDIIRIVNIQPYARRLELLGVTAQRTAKKLEEKGRRNKVKTGVFFKVPNGAYQLTTRSMKSKYKNNVGIRFSFLPGNQIGLSGTFKNGRSGKNSIGRPYLYPTMIFTVQERGIT